MMGLTRELISESNIEEFNKVLNYYDIVSIGDLQTTVFKDEDGNDVIMYSVIITHS